MTIGPQVALVEVHTWKPKNIVFPADFSETSLHALPFALSLAEETQANLILLHGTAMVAMDARMILRDKILKQLNDLLPRDASDWCNPEGMVLYEFEAEKSCASPRNARVASTHLPRATEMVSGAPGPVLTVRV